jgi:two-component system chemotaxis sensor kinase CheA
MHDIEKKLAAAQTTIAVLKRRVLALQNGDGKTTIDLQLEESRQRMQRNEQRRALMEARAAQLEEQKAVLEAEVEARTRTIRTILDNVAFGFFLLGADGVIMPGATASCVSLFGEGVAGKPLHTVLRQPNRIGDIDAALSQVFDDFMPEEVSLSLLPATCTIDGRTLGLEARLVRDKAGAPAHVLVSVSDLTALHASQLEAERNHALVTVLSQRVGFAAFLEDLREGLVEGQAAIDRSDDATVRRIVHTIKGNAACFGLSDVVEVCHKIEDGEAIDGAALLAIRTAVRAFLKTHHAVLGMSDDDAASTQVVLDTARLHRLFELINASGSAELRAFAHQLRWQPADGVLAPLATAATRLASRLEKDIEVVVTGGDILLDMDVLRPIVRSLPHVVRNAVDHGVEEPGLRRLTGKPLRATLQISATEDDSGWQLQVTDDGGGIRRGAVLAKARQLGLIGDDAREEDDALITRLIFSDALSTAEATTEISGRGVGLPALREAVIACGGSIAMRSTPTTGTSFIIRVPRPPMALAKAA